VTSVNDSNVAHLIEVGFGVIGLTSCDDKLSYDTTLDHIKAMHPPLLPTVIYNDCEPLLRGNMESGSAGWTNNTCESVKHVLKRRT